MLGMRKLLVTVINESFFQVVDEAKKLIEASPNAPFIVHEFKALSSGKVSF